MGIGAYQARSFIVASGGTMLVRSVPRQGTTIDMEIPAVQSEALDAH
jgi:signal transduction histidine kinase